MSWLSNTLGSVAGSVLGSVVQNHYNSANAAQANEWNVENYKHRYQWAVEDMRRAGLNPILAARCSAFLACLSAALADLAEFMVEPISLIPT